jgi:putative glutamine transport system substrate-binding protein
VKFGVVILCFTLAFVLTGCTKKPKKDLLTIVKARGKIIAGVKYDTKPFGFVDQDQEVKGYDVDLCREIAKRIFGSETAVEFIQVTSSNRIFAITSGSVDFAAATMTITEDRRKVIDFSSPYYTAGQAIMVPKNSKIKTLSDLANKTVIVVLGSTSEINIKQLVPTAEILAFRTYTDAFSALRSGRGDALTTDDTIVYGFITDEPNYKILGERLTIEPYGLGFRRGKDVATFRETVNFILNELAEDGTFEKLRKKWINGIQKSKPNKDNDIENHIIRFGSEDNVQH